MRKRDLEKRGGGETQRGRTLKQSQQERELVQESV